MTTSLSRIDQGNEVDRQVSAMLARSAGYNALPPAERDRIRRNTADIVGTMVNNELRQRTNGAAGSHARAAGALSVADPYAVAMADSGPPRRDGGGQSTAPQFTGGATDFKNQFQGPKTSKDFGAGIALGVQQTGQLLREVNFPAFVAELIRGVFQAVVDASIQQMKAYGELVQSVAMSLNDFRDANVSENQGRDHLVSKYPNLMQINVVDGQPKVRPKEGASGMDLPNFQADLGLDEEVSDLDEETIEDKLVPAARNDLARSRQALLATMLLMGINRIVVTDGKINAKLKFDFSAKDHTQNYAQAYDYQNMGESRTGTSTRESSVSTGSNYAESGNWWQQNRSGESSRWSKGTDTMTVAPVINLKSYDETTSTADAEASGQLKGEVSLNFKSETVDLNKLATEGDIFKLQSRSAGRGAGTAAGPGGATTGSTAAGSTTSNTSTSATTPQPATAGR